MNIRSLGIYVVMGGLALAGLTGCEETVAQKEEVARLNQIIVKTNEANRDLMRQQEALQAKINSLMAEIGRKDRKIAVLKDGVAKLQSMGRLGRKEQQQLEILAKELGGKLVGNRLELPGDFFFGSGKFDLRAESKAALKELSAILKGKNLMLLIVGYTDSDPIKNPRLRRLGVRDNRHLSLLRSLSVLNELKKNGYPEKLMYPTGWGELRPLDKSGTPTGKALNRRVEIMIDPAASGLFAFSAITDVTPAVPVTGEGGGPVTAGE